MDRIDTDVLVVGGGPAGLGAAMGAASAGARVHLVECGRGLGGQVADVGLGAICGLYRHEPAGPPRYLAGGFARSFAECLRASFPVGPMAVDGLHMLACPPDFYVEQTHRLLAETPAIEPLFDTTPARVDLDGRRLAQVDVVSGERRVKIRAAGFVDASGDAALAALAAVTTRDLSASQSAGYLVRLEGVPEDRCGRSGALRILRAAIRAARTELLPAQAACFSIEPWSAPGSLTLKFTLPPPGRETVEELLIRARVAVRHLVQFLRDAVPALAGVHVAWLAERVGVRAGRVIGGRATLTRAHVLGAARFADAVARGAWPIEQWIAGQPRPHLTPTAVGDYYEIPAGCLRPRELDNLFVAGRCISADAEGLASARVIATAMDTGWAAGRLAAGNGLDSALKEIQHRLAEVDAGEPAGKNAPA